MELEEARSVCCVTVTKVSLLEEDAIIVCAATLFFVGPSHISVTVTESKLEFFCKLSMLVADSEEEACEQFPRLLEVLGSDAKEIDDDTGERLSVLNVRSKVDDSIESALCVLASLCDVDMQVVSPLSVETIPVDMWTGPVLVQLVVTPDVSTVVGGGGAVRADLSPGVLRELGKLSVVEWDGKCFESILLAGELSFMDKQLFLIEDFEELLRV